MFGKDKRSSARLLPLLPLRDTVVFPYMVVPLCGPREEYRCGRGAMRGEKEILLCAQKKARRPTRRMMTSLRSVPSAPLSSSSTSDGTVKVLVEGRHARVGDFVPHPDYFLCEVDEIQEQCEVTPEVEALMRQLQTTFESYVKLDQRIPPEMLMASQASKTRSASRIPSWRTPP